MTDEDGTWIVTAVTEGEATWELDEDLIGKAGGMYMWLKQACEFVKFNFETPGIILIVRY